MKKYISIIIPVLNEAENIRPLMYRIHATMSKAEIIYEVIFVDDHSSDASREVIQSLSHIYPTHLYLKKGKKGKAQSLLEGFTHAQYENLCMIDADLQYPPEEIPAMLEQLTAHTDIVLAHRQKPQTSLIRRLMSKTYRYVFGQLLHDLPYDIQSGLKVFKKEIIDRITIHPSPWTFDLEFLLQARDAGYTIASHDISFLSRHTGKTKINLLQSGLQMSLEAIKLKLQPHQIIPFSHTTTKSRGHGFHYRGKEFVHFSQLPAHQTAFFRLSRLQFLFYLECLILLLEGLVFNWHTTLVIGICAMTLLYFLDLLFNLFIVYKSLSSRPEIDITEKKLTQANVETQWPTYTVLCPLYKEWQVIPQFMKAMAALDYPKNKLQVMLLLEEDDTKTLQYIQKISLPSYFEVIIVPHSNPKTKPKACNYGLQKAKGEYIVIYDAEDIPDTQQLKKVAVAFSKVPQKTVCIQAKLNFYNPAQNLLTRFFTAEYSLWFDVILPGLQALHAPIPLGGTSNHFRTQNLRELHGWDSFNVTEDCDLGIRLAKNGYNTAVIDSTTYEEANSSFTNWMTQRTRWIKGYIQTYFVHKRKSKKTYPAWTWVQQAMFQLIVGGKVLSMVINPFMWLITIVYFATRSLSGETISSFFPTPILYIGVFALFIGNFLYIYYYMVGCLKRKLYTTINFALFVPLYWLMISVATWRAVYEMIRKPHYWAKTIHGLHLHKKKRRHKQFEFIVGNKLIGIQVGGHPSYVPNISLSLKSL